MTYSYVSWVTLYLASTLVPAGTLSVTEDPWVTTWRLYLVNGIVQEWIEFNTVTYTGWVYVLGTVQRDLNPKANPTSSLSSWKTWLATQPCVLVAMHDQLVDKNQDWIQKDQHKICFGSTSSYITTNNNGNDLLFKDGNNWQTSLTSLTAWAGTDHKVLVSPTDTNAYYLSTKMNYTGNWIGRQIGSPGGDERFEYYLDFATTWEAQAGTNDTKVTTPAKIKDYFDTRVWDQTAFDAWSSNTLLPTIKQVYERSYKTYYLNRSDIVNVDGTFDLDWVSIINWASKSFCFGFRNLGNYTLIDSVKILVRAQGTSTGDIILTGISSKNRVGSAYSTCTDTWRAYTLTATANYCYEITLNTAVYTWLTGGLVQWDILSFYITRLWSDWWDTYNDDITIIWATITLTN